MSEYAQKLSSEMRLRYCDKVKCIGGIDPYTITSIMFSEEKSTLPKVQILDMMSYFVFTHSVYTTQQLKALKSLEAHKYYTAGFVHSVKHVKINNHFVVLAKVKHSQKFNEKELLPWVILLDDGSVKTAHCNCMAGLGEACSHIAATVFYLIFQKDNTVSCTDKLSTWKAPKTASKKVEFKRVRDMDWSKNCVSYDASIRKNIVPLKGPSLEAFLNKVQEVTPKAAILRVIEPFSRQFAETGKTAVLPKSLANLVCQPDMLKMSLEDLRRIKMNFNTTKKQIDDVYDATIDRSHFDILYEQVAGRISDSTFMWACEDCVDKPSLTLVKTISYPAKAFMKLPNARYEFSRKEKALALYKQYYTEDHDNFKTYNPGLVICLRHPYFAALTDLLITCDCCGGGGCVEIKCPYELKTLSIKEFAKTNDSFLELCDDNYNLKKSHKYYYQIQFQMYCMDMQYCDFVIWSKKEFLVIRTEINREFLEINLLKAKTYHDQVIVPELIGKYFTRENDPNRPVKWTQYN
ncbi:hypothetical protein TKK_0014023 [Trichogramma kaykai]|uniref:YqaJ viral recombinase domain-containing protein n=1 Tax=Trichogramma kaykai TaxID=54128 RepID=A0ABD2WA08_9HYME